MDRPAWLFLMSAVCYWGPFPGVSAGRPVAALASAVWSAAVMPGAVACPGIPEVA